MADLVVTLRAVGERATVAAIRTVGAAAQATAAETASVGTAATAAGGAIGGMATEGAVAMGGLRTALGSVASAFAPGGILLVAVTAAAAFFGEKLYGMLTSTKKLGEEADETARKIGKMVESGERTKMLERLRELDQGTYDPRTGQREGGLADSRRRVALLEAQAGALGETGMARTKRREIEEELEKTKALRAEYDLLRKALLDAGASARGALGAAAITVTAAGGGGSGGGGGRVGRPAAGARDRYNPSALDDALRRVDQGYDPAGEGADAALQGGALSARDAQRIADQVSAVAASADRQMEEMQRKLEERARLISATVVASFADGIATAVRAGDIGEGFKQLGASLLAGLGSIAIEIGQRMIGIGTLIQSAVEALQSLSGSGAVVAGVALVALGAAMTGLAGKMGAAAPRVATGGTNVGGGYAVPTVIDRGVIAAPTTAGLAAQGPVNVTATIIGPNDPSAQRAIVDLIQRAATRGVTV